MGAFSSNAASKTTCAPRAACPPSAVPSSSSAPPDGTSCATNLRCSKCDFKVMRFDDQRWSESVDYMFFRNFMGDIAKLRTKLQPQAGVAAHACQCSWCTVDSWGAKVPHDFWFRMR